MGIQTGNGAFLCLNGPISPWLKNYNYDMTWVDQQHDLDGDLQLGVEQFRLLFDIAPVGMAIVDPRDGRLLHVNDKYCEITGYSRLELREKTVFDLTHPDDRSNNQAVHLRVIHGETPQYRNEKRYLRKDGRAVWVRVNAVLLRDSSGQPVQGLGVIEDITEYKSTEAALELALEGISHLDKEGRYVSANSAYATCLGYGPREILGMPWQKTVYPEDLPQVEDAYRQMLSYGKGEAEVRGLRRDGSIFHKHVVMIKPETGAACGYYCFMKDITVQKQAEAALRESEERFRSFMDNSPSISWIKDEAGHYVYLSKTFEQRHNAKLDAWRGKTDFDVWPLEMANVFRNNDLSVLNSGQSVELTEESQNPDGSIGYWQVSKFLIHDAIGRKYVAGTGVDISKQIEVIEQLRLMRDELEQRVQERTEALLEANQRLEHQATHDALTTLVNRHEFERRLTRVLESIISDDTNVLLYLDLDQFKLVNDTCGHSAGDELLRQLAALLGAHIRHRDDTLARLGGDEFGILMEHCPLEQGLRVAEQILHDIQDFQYYWNGKSFRVGISIGLVSFTQNDGILSDILSRADRACYIAKDKGRHRVHIYTSGDTDLAHQAGEMHSIPRLQRALALDRFLLYAQPVVTMEEVCGVSVIEYNELLIRLPLSHDELLLPGAFIPSAERYHQITALDRWVVRTALATIAAYDYRDCYAINISGQSLGDGKFLRYVIEQLQNSGVAPTQLCFEITETAAITDFKHALAFITTLKEHGCRFALDDFGSGLSSFRYLKALPVDYLKIDGHFIKELLDDATNQAMVEAIQRVAQVIGIKTIAESVETAAIREQVKSLGVDFGQGYAFAQPQPMYRGIQ